MVEMAISLESLGPELVQIIIEYVNDSSPHTTKSLAGVNKYLRAATEAVVHRHETIFPNIRGDNAAFLTAVAALLEDRDIVRSINRLTIGRVNVPMFPSLLEFEAVWEPLIPLIEGIGNLKTFTWNLQTTFPSNILRALHERQPNAKLRIFNFQRFTPTLGHLDAAEAALSRSPALTHFRAECRFQPLFDLLLTNPESDYRIAAIKRIISTAPNLQYVGIIADNFQPPIVDPGDNTDGLPAIFGTELSPSSSVKALTLDGGALQLSKSDLDVWNNVLNLSQLETLKFSRGFPTADYFQNATALLPNLKHVSLNFGEIMGSSTGPSSNAILQAANAYLRNCSPLESLSLWSWTKVVTVSELIDQHCSALKTLQLHEKQTAAWVNNTTQNNRQIITLDELEEIQSGCSKLMDFTFDMNCESKNFDLHSESKNLEYFNKLATFGPHLQKLQISFDSFGLYSLFPEDDDDDDFDFADLLETGDTDRYLGTEDDGIVQLDTVRSAPAEETLLENSAVQPEDILRKYAENIWKTIFGPRQIGDRMLDIKFGEWESKGDFLGEDLRRLFEVRPHERDDRHGECFVKMRKKHEGSKMLRPPVT